MRLRRPLLVLPALACLAAIACAGPGERPSHLHELDRTVPEDGPFDANRLISLEELTDSTVDTKLLRALLTYRATQTQLRNPYGQDSFLATYFSNGRSAIDALVTAAQEHRINPIVLLVRVEMAQGLVAMEYYPTDSSRRVEYVLGCGCSAPTSCDLELAGFDRQIDCLARGLRMIVDEIDASGGVTAGGWGAGREGLTLDRKSVTPADGGTAALYQYEPLVGDSEHGAALFWNIWKLYVRASGYQSPATDASRARLVGDACVNSAQCSGIPGGLCLPYRGGMCSAPCDSTACPARDGASTYCVSTGPGGSFCFADCNVNVPSSCRNDDPAWACCTMTTSNAGEHPACVPSDPGKPRTCPTR